MPLPPESYDEEPIEAPAALLDALGFRALTATTDLAGVAAILDDVRCESCVHTWRSLPARDGATLMLCEQAVRPTRIFVYHGITPDGAREIVGAAAVSESIAHEYPYPGFPVLSRGYVRRPYRGRGLYAYLLRHRFKSCLAMEGVRAIHLGSVQEEVWRAATRPDVVDPPFVQIGEEALEVAGQTHVVRDFMAFMPDYAARMLGSVAQQPAAVEALRTLFDSGWTRAGYRGFIHALGTGSVPHDLRPFLALCEAIPLLR